MNLLRLLVIHIATLAIVACDGATPTDSGGHADVKEAARIAVDATDVDAIPQNVYWGDSHLHSSYSNDAGILGNTLGPAEAYRFARGETVTASSGQEARLIRPLDWLVIADHSEYLGLIVMAVEGDPLLLENRWGKEFSDVIQGGDQIRAIQMWGEPQLRGERLPLDDEEFAMPVWQRTLDAARQYNEPGKFTALLGYEWTSMPDADNLHRVVIFADDEDKAGSVLPFSANDSVDPEALWQWMAGYEESTGGRVLAIAHNGNLSSGLMFDDVTLSGDALSRNYAELRTRWEPLYEVTQMKGDGETHPELSTADEFADFETWDNGNFAHRGKEPQMLPREYARSALKRGLRYEDSLGANPFKFGLVGASDSHTSLATTREENYFGKASEVEPGLFPDRWDFQITGLDSEVPEGAPTDLEYEYGITTSASGLQGVWAVENTRAALFEAMVRKETYATTGTRIIVRVFGGWDYSEDDLLAPDFAERGYSGGVPMGGDLTVGDAGDGKALRLMVQALKDVDGANLDRIQVVKGWLDANGSLHEAVIDVACARSADGERKIVGGANGRQECDSLVGSTVDTSNASYENTIGAVQLHALWVDDDFDPSQRAFYYVRVLEIPTPRWSTYDAVRQGLQLNPNVPAELQDRAYTSPIWYTP